MLSAKKKKKRFSKPDQSCAGYRCAPTGYCPGAGRDRGAGGGRRCGTPGAPASPGVGARVLARVVGSEVAISVRHLLGDSGLCWHMEVHSCLLEGTLGSLSSV